jgi:hypothetical protein
LFWHRFVPVQVMHGIWMIHLNDSAKAGILPLVKAKK